MHLDTFFSILPPVRVLPGVFDHLLVFRENESLGKMILRHVGQNVLLEAGQEFVEQGFTLPDGDKGPLVAVLVDKRRAEDLRRFPAGCRILEILLLQATGILTTRTTVVVSAAIRRESSQISATSPLGSLICSNRVMRASPSPLFLTSGAFAPIYPPVMAGEFYCPPLQFNIPSPKGKPKDLPYARSGNLSSRL